MANLQALEKLITSVTEKITPLLKIELDKLGNVPKLIDDIKNEMVIAKDYLNVVNLEEEGAVDDRQKKRLRELREMVFKIEDTLEDHSKLAQESNQLVGLALPNNSDDNIGCIMAIWEWLNGCSNAVARFKMEHRVANRVSRIKKAMIEIKDNGIDYASRPKLDSSLRDPSIVPLYKDESELVGLKVHKEEVIKLLDLEEQSCKGQEQFVVAVWGQPGVGKTTLVRKVYEDESVRKHFSLFAWVTATTPYNKAQLLKCLYRQFRDTAPSDLGKSSSLPDVNKLSDDEVIITDTLRTYLKENQSKNRYMVVLDDVLEMEGLSKIIKAALAPSQRKGGRILITTKNESIANFWKTSFDGVAYNLQVLCEKDAGELFDKKAFGEQQHCPWNLKQMRDDIVNECDGLPFLIDEIGAVFSTTRNWIELYHDFQVNPLSPQSTSVLLSRYHEMPRHLKTCFLYLCMFPKGYKLDRMRIIRLWIAEGYIKRHMHNTLEEAAEEYINALVDRGMLRLFKKDRTKRNRKFQLPNMWHNIMLSKLEHIGLCQVLQLKSSKVNKACRRLSIQDNIQDIDIPTHVNTILSFTCGNRFPISLARPFKLGSIRLKVLDLQDAQFEDLPDKVVDGMRNLRYLCLRNTKVKIIPESIGQLWDLQTLDLKQTLVEELPCQIDNLHKLRHLLAGRYEDGQTVPVKLPEGVMFGKFKELQKLAFVAGNSAGTMEQLKELTQLKRLGISELPEDHGKALCTALENMVHLRSLSVKSLIKIDDYPEALDLNHKINCPRFLERLYLQGPLKQWPRWIEKLDHLVKLRLWCTNFKCDPVEKLRILEELVVLVLEDYDGEQLDFGVNGYKKLEKLSLIYFPNLKEINAGKHALSQLRKVTYEDCPTLKHIDDIPKQIVDVLVEYEEVV